LPRPLYHHRFSPHDILHHNPETLHPKPQTLNPEAQTQNSKQCTSVPATSKTGQTIGQHRRGRGKAGGAEAAGGPSARAAEPRPRDHGHLIPQSCMINHKPQIRNPRPKTLNLFKLSDPNIKLEISITPKPATNRINQIQTPTLTKSIRTLEMNNTLNQNRKRPNCESRRRSCWSTARYALAFSRPAPRSLMASPSSSRQTPKLLPAEVNQLNNQLVH